MGLESCKTCSPRTRLDWRGWVLDGFLGVAFNRECGRKFVWKQHGLFDEDAMEKNKYRIDWRIETIGRCHGSGEHAMPMTMLFLISMPVPVLIFQDDNSKTIISIDKLESLILLCRGFVCRKSP